MLDTETLRSYASPETLRSLVPSRQTWRSLASRTGFWEQPRSNVGYEVALLLAGFGLGALFMYVLDPDQGRRRRALARDRVNSFITKAEHKLGAKARHYSNRARGMAAEVRSAVTSSSEPDAPLDSPPQTH